ncbi:MAG TPA: peptidylprolyl isomerase, partial [Stellaceae bacterium]
MLQAIRSRAASLVVKVLFGMLILSFGVWGIGDIFRNRAPDTVVATVGNETIDASALQNALQPALERLRLQTGGTVDLEQAKKLGVVDRVLDELIDRGLADQETGRLRLDVSDEAVRNIISHDPTFRGQNGAFDRAAFNSMLAANHMSEGQYVATTRREIAARDLFGAITSGAAAPPALVDALYRHRNETRVADIVTLPAAGGGDVGQPTDAQLEAFYNAHKDLFRAPEYRGFTLESLTPSELAQSIEIPEAKLKEQYDQRHDDFVVPERRDVQQILAPTEAKAKEAAAALAAGKDWNEVATTIVKQAP